MAPYSITDALNLIVGIYDDDFLSPYQRRVIRREVARARFTLYMLRRAEQGAA